MNIVHIQDYFHPILGYQETFLPREQAKLRHNVYMVTSDRYSPLIYQANKSLLGNRIKGAGFFVEEGIKVWRLKTLFEIPHNIWMLGLGKKVEELRPDIVIMHGIANLTALRIAKLKNRRRNFKLVYDDHMAFIASRSKLRALYPLFRWRFSQLIQEKADALVAVADTSRMFMHRKYGIPLERIAVIPLGADHELFRFDPSSRREVRQKLSLNNEDVLFVYAGKIIEVKGPHILVGAAIRLMRIHSNVKVLLVGNGPQAYIQRMKEDIRRTYLEHRFIWHSAVPNGELPKLYSASDVAVWPCESSLSMLEAMACGLPVIMSDSSETLERVGHDNGLIYQRADASDLAQQMEKLLDPQLRMKMGHNSRKLIEDKLNWRIIARQFIEVAS